jgi:hypothetical protein
VPFVCIIHSAGLRDARLIFAAPIFATRSQSTFGLRVEPFHGFALGFHRVCYRRRKEARKPCPIGRWRRVRGCRFRFMSPYYIIDSAMILHFAS